MGRRHIASFHNRLIQPTILPSSHDKWSRGNASLHIDPNEGGSPDVDHHNLDLWSPWRFSKIAPFDVPGHTEKATGEQSGGAATAGLIGGHRFRKHPDRNSGNFETWPSRIHAHTVWAVSTRIMPYLPRGRGKGMVQSTSNQTSGWRTRVQSGKRRLQTFETSNGRLTACRSRRLWLA